MGSGTSKSSSSSGTVADRGSRGSKISCLRRSSGYISDDDHVSVSVSVETGKSKSVKPVDETKKKSYFKCNRAQEGISSICSDASSSSIQTHVTRNHGSHSCIRFGFVPRSISSRLHKAVSLGSLGSCSIFYGTPLESIAEGDYHANSGLNITGDRTEGWQVSNLLASQQFQGPSGMSGLQVVLHDQQIISSSEVARRGTNTMSESTTQGHCSSNHEEIDNTGTRLIENWVSGHESLERSMRFSRARSVGRLRDRVLCRTSSSEGVLSYPQEDREARDSRLGNMRPFCNSASRGASSSRDVETSPASNRLHPCTFSSRNNSLDCDTPSSTEARNYTDVEHRAAFLERGRIRSQGRALQRLGSQIENLSGHDRSCVLSGQHVTGQCLCQARGRTSEQNSGTNARANFDTPSSTEARNYTVHRSDFLERRRRIRSQVRALQRLDSRVENLAGHDRACILSGQHITSRCICQASGRASNQNRDPNVRASISRILLLAEALFEVLDEIHQQSAVLSSRPSVGSVPAPKEVVDCMPVKRYTKPLEYENEEAAQCYICLVEYEEGDFMRILPCHHEFHQTCIDRWLKEIHRVCPLCRGDVCHPDSPL